MWYWCEDILFNILFKNIVQVKTKDLNDSSDWAPKFPVFPSSKVLFENKIYQLQTTTSTVLTVGYVALLHSPLLPFT